MLHLSRKTCTKEFYDLILAEYPILKHKPDYKRMIQYILYGTFIDETTKLKVIPCDLVAKIEGKRYTKQYRAIGFLNAFQHDVLPAFEWTKANPDRSIARQIKCDGLPPHIKLAFYHEIRNLTQTEGGRVYFDTGEKFTRRNQSAERTRLKELALSMKTDNTLAKDILAYLNTLPVNVFNQQVSKYYGDALVTLQDVLDEIEDTETMEITLVHQSRVLRSIFDQCQVFYQPSATGLSDRIFPLTESILMLKSDVRGALTQDWIELDIKSAHLAIFGHMWQVETVLSFLHSGKSIWTELLELYDLPPHKQLKKVLKDALYSICNGKKPYLVAGDITRYGRSVRAGKVYSTELAEKVRNVFKGDIFISHPVIHAIINARDIATLEVTAEKGAYTCFGRWLSTDDYTIEGVLAAQAQAYELALIAPIYDLAKDNTNNFLIPLHLHEGVSVFVWRKAEQEMWIRRIQDVVDSKAKELGIYTQLEVK